MNSLADIVVKACPFCGSGAELRDYGRGRQTVRCLSMDCRASTFISLPGEDVIAAWNTRTDPLAALVLEAREDISVWDGDLYMLRRAIEDGDPKAELLHRVDDIKREMKATLAKLEAL